MFSYAAPGQKNAKDAKVTVEGDALLEAHLVQKTQKWSEFLMKEFDTHHTFLRSTSFFSTLPLQHT